MAYWVIIFTAIFFYTTSFFVNTKKDGLASPKNILVLFGLITEGVLIKVDTFGIYINLDFSNSLLIVNFFTVLFFLVHDMKIKNKGLDYLVLVPSIFLIAMHPFMNQEHFLRETSSVLYVSHILTAIIGYGLLTYGAIFSVFVLLLEKNLHNKKIESNFKSDEPLLGLESYLYKINILVFLLLTFIITTGLFFSKEIFEQPLIFNHKTFFSLLAWLTYAYFFYGRYNHGWRGKKAINILLVAFVFLVLSYFGSKFVLEMILHR
jgi:ABC-type uncharacterized transport system permease subunit